MTLDLFDVLQKCQTCLLAIERMAPLRLVNASLPVLPPPYVYFSLTYLSMCSEGTFFQTVESEGFSSILNEFTLSGFSRNYWRL